MASTQDDNTTRQQGKRRRVSSWIRRGLVLALVLGFIAILVWAYRPQPVAVEVAEVDRGEIEVRVREDGQTRVKHRYVVSAPLSARLLRSELSPGDRVAMGQVVARLLPVDAPLLDAPTRAEVRARVNAARAAMLRAEALVERVGAQLAFAEGDAERQRQLHAKGAVSQRRLDEAMLSVSTLRKELASAEFAQRVARNELSVAKAAERRATRKGDTSGDDAWELVAPAAGRVLRVMQESEGVVQPGTPLLEVGDCGALEVVVDVLTSDAVALSPGADVDLDRWGGDGILEGHVRRVEPRAFTERSALGIDEQRVSVLVDLDSPPERWQALCDGYRVEAALLLERKTDALRVPVGALFRDGTAWATYLMRDGRAVRTTVQTGSRNDASVEITAGLEQGQQVIVFPSDQIEDGSLVEPR